MNQSVSQSVIIRKPPGVSTSPALMVSASSALTPAISVGLALTAGVSASPALMVSATSALTPAINGTLNRTSPSVWRAFPQCYASRTLSLTSKKQPTLCTPHFFLLVCVFICLLLDVLVSVLIFSYLWAHEATHGAPLTPSKKSKIAREMSKTKSQTIEK